MRTPWLLLPILILNLTSAVSCHRKAHSGGGVVDGGGGGFVPLSKPEEVRAALRQALELGSNPVPQRNIFVKFILDAAFDRRDIDILRRSRRVFPNLIRGSVRPEEFDRELSQALRVMKPEGGLSSPGKLSFDVSTEGVQSPVLARFLDSTNIQIRDAGDCAAGNGGHGDASVTSNSLNGKVCFSIGNLTRLTQEVLLKEILALMLHEAAHLGGADEEEAMAWQSSFSKYFNEKFLRIEGSQDLVSQSTKLARIGFRRFLNEVNNLDTKGVNFRKDIQILILKAPRLEDQFGFKAYGDRLVSNLLFSPKSPERFNQYSNSVSALLERRNSLVDLVPLNDELDARQKFKEDLLEYAKALEDLMDKALKNFSAYIHGGPPGECILPSYKPPGLWWSRVPKTCDP